MRSRMYMKEKTAPRPQVFDNGQVRPVYLYERDGVRFDFPVCPHCGALNYRQTVFDAEGEIVPQAPLTHCIKCDNALAINSAE